MEKLRHYVEHVGTKERHVIELPSKFAGAALEEFDQVPPECEDGLIHLLRDERQLELPAGEEKARNARRKRL